MCWPTMLTMNNSSWRKYKIFSVLGVYESSFTELHNLVWFLSGHLANAASELMKLDHEEPQLTEPYLSKQKKLMVSQRFHGIHDV